MIPTLPTFPTGNKESQCIMKKLRCLNTGSSRKKKKVNSLHFYSILSGRGVNSQDFKAYLIHRWGKLLLKLNCIKKGDTSKGPIYTIIWVIWLLFLTPN